MDAFYTSDNANDYRATCLKRVEGKDLTGQIIIVTGATGALGKEMALALAAGGATVIMAARTMTKLEAAKAELMERAKELEQTKGITADQLMLMTLDLSDYESIAKFAAEIKANPVYHQKINVLINNAGMIPSLKGYKESKYGLETTFQVNFVSTVILTELLIPSLSPANGRIVHQSTMSHRDAPKPMKYDKVPSTAATFGGYNKDYCESKWLLTAYSSSLARRFAADPVCNLKSACADPGVSPDSAMWDEQIFVLRFLVRYVFKFLTKTSPQAASCAVQMAVTPLEELESGGYYQSGVLGPPLRVDATDGDEWKSQVVPILQQALPAEYKWCARED